MLVERFVRAVREDGIAPGRILAITFTERAAGELRERVRARLLELGESAAARATEGAYVGTFHGFCARVLRARTREAGLGRSPRSWMRVSRGDCAGRRSRRARGVPPEGERGEAVDLIAAYGADRARATVLGVYAELRSRGARAPRLPTPQPGREPAGQAELDLEAADMDMAGGERLWPRWTRGRACRRAVGRAAGAIRRALRAGQAGTGRAGLRRSGVARERAARGEIRLRLAWAERFELLMVDELQDVNPRQLRS